MRTKNALMLTVTMLGSLGAGAQQPTITPDSAQLLQLLRKAQLQDIPLNTTSPPFQLAATYQLFDEAGKPTSKGTMELLWDGKDRWRDVLTRESGGTQERLVRIRNNGFFRSPQPFLETFFLRALMDAFQHPVPPYKDLPPISLTLKTANLSGIPADCLVFGSTDTASAPDVPLSSYASVFCLSQKNQSVRYAQLPPEIEIVYNHLQPFGPKAFAQDIQVTQNKITRATLHLEFVRPWTVDEASLTPGADAVKEPAGQNSMPRIPNEALQHLRVFLPSGSYPPIAAQANLSGHVIVAGVLSPTGQVTEVEVISTTNPIFSDAALDQVRNSRYKPWEVNGQPVQATFFTTIVFRLPPRKNEVTIPAVNANQP